jgi:hypothetical protein
MDLNKLKGHIPDSVIGQLPDTIAKFELNTPLRLAHFLAQAGHESGGFKAVKETFNIEEGIIRCGDDVILNDNSELIILDNDVGLN